VIDYNPEVLALAGTELAAWNGSSLADHRVVVEVADVRKALAKAGSFHAIFSDLTAPGTLADCGLFTRDWFRALGAHLEPGGILASTGSLRTRPRRRTGASTRPSARQDSPRSRACRASPASPSWDTATGGSSSAPTDPSHPLRSVRYPFPGACGLSTGRGSWTASSFPGDRPTRG
jgi:spermidine synthase